MTIFTTVISIRIWVPSLIEYPHFTWHSSWNEKSICAIILYSSISINSIIHIVYLFEDLCWDSIQLEHADRQPHTACPCSLLICIWSRDLACWSSEHEASWGPLLPFQSSILNAVSKKLEQSLISMIEYSSIQPSILFFTKFYI